MIGLNSLAAVLVPVKVKVRAAAVPVKATAPLLVKLNEPDPEASITPKELERVNKRSVLAFAPVYFKVPPPNTRLPASLEAFPRFPSTPPLPMLVTLNVPAVIVVEPV